MTRTTIPTQDRDVLVSRLREARAQTDEIFALIEPGALYERPIPERHRLVFYLGHLEAFDWNLVARQACGLEPFHPDFDRLFAFGIDPVDGGLPDEPASSWPGRPAVEEYNRRVRERLDECVSGRVAGAQDPAVVEMAIEHRLMHAETLAYLLHQLPYAAKRAPRSGAPPTARAPEPEARRTLVPAGPATLGRPADGPGFGWDNEFSVRVVDVPEFSIDVHKVTNRRFLEFVRDGGYAARELWTDTAWDWIQRSGIRHPTFWNERDREWTLRGMFAETPLPLAAPAWVSHAEASAFARWAGKSLPTEAQFHRAAYGTPAGGDRDYPWGAAAPDERHGNFDFHGWDPMPVGAHPASASAFGVDELVGNGWEWTSSVFEPLPGFRPHPFYPGYSANFFDDRHYVMKGGSPRTAACMLRRSFRNWFQPLYPYVYAGFRLVDE